MSSPVMRLLTLSVFIAIVVAFSSASSQAMSPQTDGPPVPQQNPTTEPREGPIPCDPVWDRSVEPRVVKMGDEVTVEATWNFKCSGETRQINYMLLIENSSALRQGRGGREALDNVVDGARDFVNQVDYANGSTGGLMLYANRRTIRLPPQGGEQGRKAMLEALGNIPLPPIDNANGAGGAIRDATGLLPTGVSSEALNVLIIIDAGAQEVPGEGPPIIDRNTACNAARQSGVLVTVLGFPEARGRMLSCATRGWYFTIQRQTGDDVPDKFEDLTEAILRGREMRRVDYSDWLMSGFEYVEGTGYPRDYDYEVIGEYTWEFEGRDAPPSGQLVRYQVDIDPQAVDPNMVTTIANDAGLTFNFSAGDPVDVEMPNPEICIYETDRTFCDHWAGPLTPTAAPPTPGSPTAVPTTQEPPTAVPTTEEPPTATTPPVETPVPSDTPDTSLGFDIFLPVAHNGAG